MSSEVEAAAAAVTAGLAGAAIEQEARVRKGREPPHGPCVNCGAEIKGNYCAQCGQPAHIHRTLGHMAHEFLHSLFHFDTRAWKTLPLLLFRPGTLTHNYIHGKRARYVSPLAVYLLTVFLMFFVFSLGGGLGVGNAMNREMSEHEGEAIAAVAEAGGKVAELQGELTAARASPDLRDPEKRTAAQERLKEAESQVTEARAELSALRKELAAVQKAAPKAGAPPLESVEAGSGDDVYDQIRKSAANEEWRVDTGWPLLDARIRQKLQNPELAVYQFQQAAYKEAFLLVPISLPFVWLMFIWRRGVTLFDHSVYILYSLSFVSLVFVFTSLVGMLPGVMGWLWAPVVIGALVHSFFHLKGGYGLSWFSALWRLPFQLLFASICLGLFVVAVLVLGLLE